METLARWCQRRRGGVLVAWAVVVIALSALSGALAGHVSDDYDLPSSESQRAAERLEVAGFGFRAGNQAQIVVHRPDGLRDPVTRATVERIAEHLSDVEGAEVVSPFDRSGERQLSQDGRTGYVAVNLPTQKTGELAETSEQMAELREEFDGAGLTVEVGGLVLDQDGEGGPPAELIGIVTAMVVLLLAFGSLLAMALPIVVGVVGAASGVAVVGVGANWVDMPSFAAPVAAMIAIGVGIDYALLVVTRFREALHDGLEPADAIVLAQSTAGRSVLFAGITVVIASLGLVMMNLKLITGVALGIAASVLITMLAAVTLLPALLAFLGHRLRKSGRRSQGVPGGDGTSARRWSRVVQRRPHVWAVAATAALVFLSIPALDLRLGFGDAGTRPTTDTSRRAYDLLADGFGPGTSGPLVLAAELGGGEDRSRVEGLVTVLRDDSAVADVSPPILSEDGSVAVVQVIPTTGPRAAATTDLVHRIRDDLVPTYTAGSDVDVLVGGTTAAAVDFADYTADRLPLFLGVVLGLALLLLLVVFRGLFVAVKAVVVNLLSISASFGAVVAVFQWGWGVEVLDLGASAPVEAWAPMMLIAIVFGLSMDYEVFLLSRIREAYDAGAGNAEAVSEGLARTARVITAAAAIMVCVFGSFVLGSSRELQLFGFGLAFAVLIDATVVRMVLVPALMELVGDRNWWLPGWLDQSLPHLTVEGARHDVVTEPAAELVRTE